MVFVLVLGGCLAWYVHLARQARIQRDAVAAITRLGGSVLYDWQFEGNQFRLKPGTTIISNEVPGWPRWLVDRLGVDAFGSVSQVSFRRLPREPSPAEAEEVLAQIGHLRRLKQLTFINVPVSDTGLAHLEGLTNLESFMLRGSNRVTDAGVAHLARLTGLKELYLEDSRISDAGLADLKELTGLGTLNLARTQIGDAGLAHLERLTSLENLGLDGTKVTDAGLVRLLRGRTILKTLYLNDTQIGDVGLEVLKGKTGLVWLSLRNTHVSDVGLEHLRELTKLHSLDLSNTRVSDDGLEGLREALPGLTIKQSTRPSSRPPQP
jgi:Leucine-rich repeat (LRR) protein